MYLVLNLAKKNILNLKTTKNLVKNLEADVFLEVLIHI